MAGFEKCIKFVTKYVTVWVILTALFAFFSQNLLNRMADLFRGVWESLC